MSRLAHVALIGFTSLVLILSGLGWNATVIVAGKLPPDDATPAAVPERSTATVTPTAISSPTPTAPAVAPAPTATPTRLPVAARLPILMYHYISVPPPNADRYRLDLSVTPQNFERQLQYLRANGFTTIGLHDLYAHLAHGAPLPPRPIILTFDDGYIDHYQHAFPLLMKYGMTGTFFVTTDFINYNNPNHLTWAMVKEMSDAGMHIESHARTHRDLRNRDFQFLVWEILGPIEQITAYTGKRPRFFCYPSGRYDDAVIRVLKSVDTLAAVTTVPGSTYTLANRMTWPRTRIHGRGTLDQFAALVRTPD